MRISPLYLLIFLISSPGLRGLGAIYSVALAFAIGVYLTRPKYTSSIDSTLSLLLLYYVYLLVYLPLTEPLDSISIPCIRLIIPVFLVIIVSLISPKNLIILYKSIYDVALLSLALILVQHFFGSLSFLTDDGTRAGLIRPSTNLGNSIVFGAFAPMLILSTPFYFSLQQSYSPESEEIRTLSSLRLQAPLYFASILLGSILTLSRAATLLTILSLFIYYIRSLPTFSQIRATALSFNVSTQRLIVFVLSLTLLIYLAISHDLSYFFKPFFLMYSTLFDSGATFTNSYNDSIDVASANIVNDFFLTRISLPWAGVTTYLQNPLSLFIGIGPVTYGSLLGIKGLFTHNFFLDIFVSSGVLGLLIAITIGVQFIILATRSSVIRTEWSLSFVLLWCLIASQGSGLLFHPALLLLPLANYTACLRTRN